MTKKRTYRTGSLFRRGKIWWIQVRATGGRYRESSQSEDRRDAERLLRKRLGELASERLPVHRRITISDLCDLVVQDYRLRCKLDVEHVIWRSDRHIRPKIGNVAVTQLSSDHLKHYIIVRRSEKASDATINRELAIIRRGFSLAYRSDPPLVTRVPYIEKLEEHNVREGFVEPDQYLKLRDALPKRLKCLLVVGYHVGCRKGELLKVCREQIDLRHGEIRLSERQTKGKKARTLPIYGEMRPWLEMQLAELEQWWPDCRWVFHHNGHRLDPHLSGWKESCKKVGLPGLLFHDLRRSAVRNMERAGIPRKVAMQISGHQTEAVYRRYDIVAPQDLRLAGAKMERYLAEPKLATELATPTKS